jgi:hypothetical protein
MSNACRQRQAGIPALPIPDDVSFLFIGAMSLRRLGISNYLLFRGRQVQSVGDDKAAQLLLEQFRGDTGAMHDLEALLAESDTGLPQARLTSDQLLGEIARMLASGELLLVREGPVQAGSGSQLGATSQPAAPPPSSPTTSSKSQAPENPSLPSNTDGAAQAAALAAAAASGTPFCSH